MRTRSAVLLGVVAMLAGCASSQPAMRTIGAYETLQPRLVSSPSGTRLHLTRPAYIQVLRISPAGVDLLYPDHAAEPSFFEPGAHTLDVPMLRQAPAGGCTVYESSVSAYGDEPASPGSGSIRTFTRRGQRRACHRPGAMMGSYVSPVWHVLVLASEEPLLPERIREVAASFMPVAGADPSDAASDFATRLTEAEGISVWAGFLSTVMRVR